MTTDFDAILASDRTTLGTWNQIAAPEMIDLIGGNGFDFAIIDCEHGPFGIEAAERQGRACQAAGIAALVRVPANDPVWITKALDAGLSTVVVPNIASGEDAERAVAATRFAPGGIRGACPCVRSGGHFITDWPAYVGREEKRAGIVALVESVEGVENFDAIARVEGLKAIMFGPFDLSVSMGLGGDWRDADVSDAISSMVERAIAQGHTVMMPVFSADPAESERLVAGWRVQGVRCFAVGADKIILASALSNWSAKLRA